MIDITKQKVIFIRREESAAGLASFTQVLESTVTLATVNASALSGPSELRSTHPPENPRVPLFLELAWIQEAAIAFTAEWQEWNVVLVKNGSATPAAQPWLEACSCLDVSGLSELELPHALELAVAPEKLPGIVAVCGPSAEIYFEKVTRLRGLGQRLDRFQDFFESNHPELAGQLFNLRQLTYALVYQAFEASAAASKLVPVVDFQVAADGDRIVFSTRFTAAPQTMAHWARAIARNENLLLRNALFSADLLAFTELGELHQIEIKAVISSRGNSAGATGGSLLFAAAPDFAAAPEVLAAQERAKFYALSGLATKDEVATAPEPEGEPEKAGAAPPAAGGLNFKIKAEMLENEKVNLQGLVKKKSHLISELTKDVNRAQRDVVEAQKTATKEILKMRMETEKAKNEGRDAKRKLAAMQRKLAEAAEEKTKQEEPKQDFEKDFKQSELARRNLEAQLKEQKDKAAKTDELLQKSRKETGVLAGEVNSLRQQLLHATQRAANAATAAAGQKEGGEDGGSEKLKAAQKQLAEAKGKEQELEKVVKGLTLKLAAAENNLKAHEAMAAKQAEGVEKSHEEAKRQRSEMTAKLDEAKAEAKKKLEESNERERALKKQIDELKAELEKLAGAGQAKAS